MAEDVTAAALRGARIEPNKPKKLEVVATFRDYTGKLAHEPYRSDMLLLRHCIEQGKPIPRRMYRAGIDRDDDALLATLGVKHFHLGAQNSNVLVYATEFADRVYLLEINDHKHLERKPVGKILEATLRTALKQRAARSPHRRNRTRQMPPRGSPSSQTKSEKV